MVIGGRLGVVNQPVGTGDIRQGVRHRRIQGEGQRKRFERLSDRTHRQMKRLSHFNGRRGTTQPFGQFFLHRRNGFAEGEKRRGHSNHRVLVLD